MRTDNLLLISAMLGAQIIIAQAGGGSLRLNSLATATRALPRV